MSSSFGSPALFLVACLGVALSAPLLARASDDPHVLLTREEALELAFPKCEIEAESLGLEKAELKRVETLAGTPHTRRLVRRHRATGADGELVGTAYVDLHRVRTLRESLLVVVDTEGRVARIEILAFAEPKAYMARAKWLAQFIGHELDEELSLKGRIRGIAGATLTARATTDAVRRVLAIDQVLAERATPPPKETPPKDGPPPPKGTPPEKTPPKVVPPKTPPKTPPERGGSGGRQGAQLR